MSDSRMDGGAMRSAGASVASEAGVGQKEGGRGGRRSMTQASCKFTAGDQRGAEGAVSSPLTHFPDLLLLILNPSLSLLSPARFDRARGSQRGEQCGGRADTGSGARAETAKRLFGNKAR